MDSDKLARNVSIAVVVVRVLKSSNWGLYIIYAVTGIALYWSFRTAADLVTGKEYIRVLGNKELKGIIIGTTMEKVHRDETDKYNYHVVYPIFVFFFVLNFTFRYMV